MPSLRPQILLMCLVLSPASPALAQSPLTLDQAVAAALARNASLRAARAGVDEAEAHRVEARSGFFPQISFSESWQRSNDPVFVFSSILAARQFTQANFAIDALNHPDPTGFFRARLGVEQLLYDGGRERAVSKSASLAHDGARASLDAASADLAVATTEAFGRLLTAEASRRSAEAGFASADEDRQRAEQRRSVGMATDADVLSLVVQAADLRQRSIAAQGEAAAARAELNRLMGAPVDSPIDPVVPAELTDAPATQTPLATLLAEADRSRPEIARAIALRRSAEEASREAHGSLLPQVAAQGGVDLSGTTFSDRASSWMFGGELRWRFSLGGGQVAGVHAGAAALERTRASEEDARAAVHAEVVAAVSRLDAAMERQKVGRATVDQARESQRIVRDRYEAGMAPTSDLLRVAAAVLNAEASRTAALVDAIVARATLRRALGQMP